MFNPKDKHHFKSPETLFSPVLISHSITRIKNMSMVEKETTINTLAVLDHRRLRCLLRLKLIVFSKIISFL